MSSPKMIRGMQPGNGTVSATGPDRRTVPEHTAQGSQQTRRQEFGEPVVTTATNHQGIDPRAFRDTLGLYASGVTVITGIDGQGPIGFTCQSFYSVSTEPPLISFSVMKTSTTYPRIRQVGTFAVNVLSHHQQEVSNQFARKDTDKWAGIHWSRTRAGTPVLDDTLMWLDCQIWAEHDAGDHLIVLGKVNEITRTDRQVHEPLLHFKGQYRHLRPGGER